MKTILIKSTSLLLLSLFLLSSCTVEKRRYSSGYHVDWHFNKRKSSHSVNKTKETKIIAQKTNVLHLVADEAGAKNDSVDFILPSQTSIKIVMDSDSFQILTPSEYNGTIKISANNTTHIQRNVPLDKLPEIKRLNNSNEVSGIPVDENQKEKNHSGAISLFILGGISLLVGAMMWVGISGASGLVGALLLGLLGLGLGILGIILLITALTLLLSRKKTVEESKIKP